jgi:hypothetical protein
MFKMINLTMSRAWFLQLGLYDEGMNVWGGEQIELSLRQKPTTFNQGVTKRCRLSLLTNSALVYESQCGRMGGGGELRGLSQ